MADYSFMKSGFDNLESKDETLENIGSLVMVFMENAMKSADIYVKHAKKKTNYSRRYKTSINVRGVFHETAS